jgi:hypothetical protein
MKLVFVSATFWLRSLEQCLLINLISQQSTNVTCFYGGLINNSIVIIYATQILCLPYLVTSEVVAVWSPILLDLA